MKHERSAWILAGVALLRAGRFDTLTINALCQRLAVTKGAFYHHFADIDAYRTALLGYWQDEHTQRPIDVADRSSAQERRAALYGAIYQLDLKLERAFRAWATVDGEVRRICERVDIRRIAYLEELWRDEAEPERAVELARLEYTLFLGGLFLPSTALRDTLEPYERVRALISVRERG